MEIDLSKIKNVHFIGIGGIGISAIARMMIEEGKSVSGQDMQDSELIGDLRNAGANISIGQSFETIPQDADLIVYTIAIENYDPELFSKLKNQAIPIRSYPEMLHIVTEGKYTIAISGTHGKTTTTGMIAKILTDSNFDPTVIIGSILQDQKSNFIAGKSKYFVVEACEYKRSFLNINPNILVITNIDADHLDYYKDIEDIKSAFRELASKVPEDGFVICNSSDPYIIDVVNGIEATVIDYTKFFDSNMPLLLPGIHNKQNASCATAVGLSIGIDKEKINESLVKFSGTSRRFEFKGTLSSGTKIYDDYAHHPTEILASLQGFRELYPKDDGWKLTVLFQPHLFSRTKSLLADFAKSFVDADTILILPIYYAREVDDGSISSHILAQQIGPTAQAYNDFESATKHINSLDFSDRDIIITMGAGDAFKIGDELLVNSIKN